MRPPLIFKKYSGAGNSFLIHLNKHNEGSKLTAKQIAWACQNAARETTDGLIFLSRNSNENFTWDFFNQDGSAAEMCGNAARCVGALIYDIEGSHKVKLQTIAGEVEITRVEDLKYDVKMPKIKSPVMPVKLSIDGTEIWGRFVDSGVPHFVWELKAESNFEEFKAKAAMIRGHSFFRPKGTNVTLVRPLGPSDYSAVTFERGVEDFTLACGTGAVAAARVLAKNKEERISISMPGGMLTVYFDQDINQPHLSGPAQFVEEVEIGEFEI